MKKYCVVFLCVIVLFSCGKKTVMKKETPAEKLTYEAYKSDKEPGIKITGLKEVGLTEVVIPEKIQDLPVLSIGKGKNSGDSYTGNLEIVKSITFPSTLIDVEDDIFCNCDYISDVDLSKVKDEGVFWEILEQVFEYSDANKIKITLDSRLKSLIGSLKETSGRYNKEVDWVFVGKFKSSIKGKNLSGFVKIKGGEFINGKGNSVSLSDFEIMDHEVTQSEWVKVMENNPSVFFGEDLPVETIGLYDAIEFCNKLSEKEKRKQCYKIIGDDVVFDVSADGYRLPTVAEWEYAARGGDKSKGCRYSGSNNVNEVAWFRYNFEYDIRCGLNITRDEKDFSANTEFPFNKEEYYEQFDSGTHKVKTKAPNELGLYDMSGNVWEWCWDVDENAFLRGGGWDSKENQCEVSPNNSPDIDSGGISFIIGRGFRVVRSCR